MSYSEEGMQKEIGGYIEFEHYARPMLHEKAVALNSARNALACLIQVKKIQKLWIPTFLCSSVRDLCRRENVSCEFYEIGMNFMPEDICCKEDDWVYIVNYYGQLDNAAVRELHKKYKNMIVDNVQAYFQMPAEGIDTIYSCRKFFGVPDGAILYTDRMPSLDMPQDESYDKMRYLLGRFERTASEFYNEYGRHEEEFADEPLMRMSKLTYNLLHGIDYEAVKDRRTKNFKLLHEFFSDINQLNLNVPEGAFMYPLLVKDGAWIRKKLQRKKIYIPTLWQDVFAFCERDGQAYNMAENILPLPVDQRYGMEDMKYMISEIQKLV